MEDTDTKQPLLETHKRERDHELRNRMQKRVRNSFMGVSEEDAKKRLEEAGRPSSRYSFSNIFWFLSAIAVFHFTDFYIAVRYDPSVKREWLYAGLILICVTCVVAVFFILYLSCIKKVHSDDWERECPIGIPIATASFIFGSLCLVVALWPLWNILTPFILLTLFMGFIVFIAVLPAFV